MTVGMFAAVLSVLSILTVPMPSGVPLTLQTFAVALCGYVLGAKRGGTTVLIYIVLGAVGVPVFSGMHGGISWLVSYTGGFLWGFVLLTVMCGISMTNRKTWYRVALSGTGLVLCHAIGVLQFSLVAETSLEMAVVTVSLPYMIKDVISVIGAYVVSLSIRKYNTLRENL